MRIIHNTQRLDLRRVFPLMCALVCLLCTSGAPGVLAADYYWVGNSGNWSDYANHWATTSGGTIFRHQVPSPDDNVIFDQNSFTMSGQTVTLDVPTATCENMDWRFVDSTPTFNSSSAGNKLIISGSMWLAGTLDMTYSMNGILEFDSPFAGNEVETGGHTLLNNVTFDQPGGGWQLNDDLEMPSYTMTLGSGTLDFNEKNVTVKSLVSDNSLTRTLDMTNSTVDITGALNVNGLLSFDFSNTSGLTFLASGSTLLFTSNYAQQTNQLPTLGASGLTFNDVHFQTAQTWAIIYGQNNTFADLRLDGNTTIRNDHTCDSLFLAAGKAYTLTAGNTLTVNDGISATGNCEEYIMIESENNGQTATISKPAGAAVVVDYVIIKDVIASGVSFSAANGIGLGTTTGWALTNTAPSTLYWIGDTGDWSNGSNWSTSSGGGAAGCTPTPVTDVIFDDNSFSDPGNPGDVVTVDGLNQYCRDMSWESTVTGTPVFESAALYTDLEIHGSLTFTTGMNMDYDSYIHFEAKTSGHTIKTAGHSFNYFVFFNGHNGEWSLAGYDLNSTSLLYLYHGTFRTANFDVHVKSFDARSNNQRGLDLGNSTFTVDDNFIMYPEDAYPGVDTLMDLQPGMSTIEILTGNLDWHLSQGYSYYDVDFLDVNGIQTAYGPNTYNDVVYAGSGVLSKSSTYNDLKFSAGNEYTLGGTHTLNGQLIANGNCTQYISIKNGGFASGNNQTVSFTLLQNNTASGALFTANTSIDGGGNTGWTIIPGSSNTFYWVGGSGNWSDPNSWANSTGGSPGTGGTGGCVPSANDDVIFDNLSFPAAPAPSSTVTGDLQNMFCRNMTWKSGILNNPTFIASSANNRMRIWGSLEFQSLIMMELDFAGDFFFESRSAGQTLTTRSQQFDRSVRFDGPGGEWTLQDDLTLTSGARGIGVIVSQGDFISAGHTINAGMFDCNGSGVRSVDIRNSIVNLFGQSFGGVNAPWVSPTTTNLNPFLTDGSTINITTSVTDPFFGATLLSNNLEFNNVVFPGTGVGVIRGSNNTFKSVVFSHNGYFYNSNAYDYLEFTPGYTYTLASGTIQTINTPGTLNAVGTPGASIFIKSSVDGDRGFFAKEDGVVCLDYVDMRDNEALILNGGGVQFYAGPHSANTINNQGWAFMECTPPPTIFGCDGEEICFDTDLSIGSWLWDFDDPLSGPNNTSTLPEPCHTFSGPGTYNVHVDVSSLTTSDRRFQTVEIYDVCCPAAFDPAYFTTSGTISTTAIWSNKVYVAGDIVITAGASLDITNVDVVFAPDAGITLQGNAQLQAHNSTFRHCAPGGSWDGISFGDQSSGTLQENVFVNAHTGINALTDSALKISNNEFLNNRIGISFNQATLTTVDHEASGNTFVIDEQNPFSDYQSTTLFYGIAIADIHIGGIISQNNFTYNSDLTTPDETYGIFNGNGNARISENVVTNFTFAYFQTGGNAVSTFENNEVEYNKAIVSVYTPVAAAITIENNDVPTLIAGNELRYSFDAGVDSRAIYINNAFDVIINNNDIRDFRTGIQIIGSSGTVAQNRVVNARQAIIATEAFELHIDDNKIDLSTAYGMTFSDCVESIFVRRNEIRAYPEGLSSVGILYEITGSDEPNDVEFLDNCVWNTREALQFFNYDDPCKNIPLIRGNYLYNYSIGLNVLDFVGQVGSCASPSTYGRNSFVGNIGGVDVNVDNSTLCDSNPLILDANWPWPLNAVGDVVVNNSCGEWHSISECGNQVRIVAVTDPAFVTYARDRFPVRIAGDRFQVTENYIERIVEIPQSLRYRYLKSLTALLGASGADDARRIVAEARAAGLLDAAAVAWLEFDDALLRNDVLAAREALNVLTGSAAADRKEYESIRLQYRGAGRSAARLLDDEVAALQAIDARGGAYAATARALTHRAIADHPYNYYRTVAPPRFTVVPEPWAPMGENAIRVFPNPAQAEITLQVAFADPSGMTARIHDVQGRVALQAALQNSAHGHTLDISGLSAGIYFVSVVNHIGERVQTVILKR